MRSRDRRAMRIGVIYIVLYSCLKLAVLPAMHMRTAQQAELAKERRRLAEELGLLEWAARATPEAQALNERIAKRLASLFDGLDPNLTAADMLEHVRQLADAAPMTLTQLLASTDSASTDGLRKVGITVTGVTDFEGVMELIRTVENGRRAIHVDYLDVKHAGANAVDYQSLDVQIRLSAYAVDLSDLRASGQSRPPIVAGAVPTARVTNHE